MPSKLKIDGNQPWNLSLKNTMYKERQENLSLLHLARRRHSELNWMSPGQLDIALWFALAGAATPVDWTNFKCSSQLKILCNSAH